MKKTPWLLFLMPLVLVGCKDQHQPKADNNSYEVNAPTADDQSENEQDITITQRVRRALMKDDSLSTNAKNIKIITVSRVVTLRGTVDSNNEKDAVAKKVEGMSGVSSVNNQLEVK